VRPSHFLFHHTAAKAIEPHESSNEQNVIVIIIIIIIIIIAPQHALRQPAGTVCYARGDLSDSGMRWCAAREWEARAGQRMVRRAAFDVGSGAVKMSIADLDTHAGVLPSIENEVYSMRENLLLSEELERSGGQAFPQVCMLSLPPKH